MPWCTQPSCSTPPRDTSMGCALRSDRRSPTCREPLCGQEEKSGGGRGLVGGASGGTQGDEGGPGECRPGLVYSLLVNASAHCSAIRLSPAPGRSLRHSPYAALLRLLGARMALPAMIHCHTLRCAALRWALLHCAPPGTSMQPLPPLVHTLPTIPLHSPTHTPTRDASPT